jgi:hypothetical protein
MLPCWYTGLATVGKADLTTNTLISMLLALSEDLYGKLFFITRRFYLMTKS